MQQQLNGIVSDNVVSRIGTIFGMLSRRACLSATAGLSCLETSLQLRTALLIKMHVVVS